MNEPTRPQEVEQMPLQSETIDVAIAGTALSAPKLPPFFGE